MKKQKYPRTIHIPWSQGAQSDDKTLKDTSGFRAKEYVITEKMDGENTTMYRDCIHARSLDSRHHPSRDWVKNYWNQFRFQIPDGLRICGENVFAQHSIPYDGLESYFYAFSVWRGDECLGWDETKQILDGLGIRTPKELYRGPWDEEAFKRIAGELDTDKVEGYVVRNSGRFNIKDFSSNVAKFVRKGHVQTDSHWMNKEVIPNGLKKS